MYCPYCGTQVPENAAFCSSCGKKFPEITSAKATPQSAPLPSNNQSQLGLVDQPTVLDRNQSKASRKPMSKKRMILIVISMLLVLAVAATGTGLFLWFNNPHRSSEALAEAYVTALRNNDPQAVIALIPEQTINYMVQTYYGTRENFEDDLERSMSDYYNRAINSVDRTYLLKDRFLGYEIEVNRQLDPTTEGEYNSLYQKMGIAISEIKIIDVSVRFKYLSGAEDTHSIRVEIIKIGNKWYLDLFSQLRNDAYFLGIFTPDLNYFDYMWELR